MRDLPKQHPGPKPKYKQNKLKLLHLPEINFRYLGTNNTYYIF